MITIKSKQEIEIMKKGGAILAQVMREVLEHVRPGVSELGLEKLANDLIIKKGAFPGFKKVQGYKYATCLAVNDVVVHGLPKNNLLKEGDIIGIDCGVYFEGFHTDMAETVKVQGEEKETDEFLQTGRKALNEAIKMAKPGNRIGHISQTIQDIIESHGYSIVRNLVGHGVGKKLHEEPEIPGFVYEKIEKTPLIKEGMTLAIEVIYNKGKKEVKTDTDGWTIRTRDGSLSGLFERSIVVTEKGPVILTN
ncbi:type I methionyl aminopeptidase [Patescibacteria group bacterium]|nr:type I methionyl aminopeptidase [Patescibacteria group bacterium]